MRRIFAALVMIGLAGAAPLGCGRVVEGVLTAAPAFLIGESQEIAIGLQGAREIVAETPIYPDPRLAGYVQRLGARVAATTERADLPWTFTVLRSDEPDAFALPGGYVFLTTGMIKRMRDEAELVGVLSHEIGHITSRHALELIRQAAVAQGLTEAVIGQDSGATALLANVVTTLVLRGYGRSKEIEADQLGARYAAGLGFDPQALGDMLTRLELESGGAPAWLAPLSTHPTLDERLSALNTTIATLGGGGGGGGTGGTGTRTPSSRGDGQAFAAATASLR